MFRWELSFFLSGLPYLYSGVSRAECVLLQQTCVKRLKTLAGLLVSKTRSYKHFLAMYVWCLI